MLFNSYSFIFVFLPLVVAGYYACLRGGLEQTARQFLVLSSLVFYGWWNPVYLLLLIPSIGVNYAIGSRLAAYGPKAPGKLPLVLAGIALNLGLIGYFKYANFFVDSINAGFGTSLFLETIILPLAISFFTFQQIAFLVDSHRGKVPQQTLVNYALFVSFFPQLIAGPIVHHSEMMPQFKRKASNVWARNILIGSVIFSIGLAKKVLIADSIAPYANIVFNAASAGEAPSFLMAWQGAFAYSLQLYFDFSGYSDMAIGLARIFGIVLPLNFNSPFKSANIAVFWNNWHMTLSRFLRDYVYIPLGGNRAGNLKRLRNLFLTMVIGGIWHGAGWTFVLWGALHGAFLVTCQLWGQCLGVLGLQGLQKNRFYLIAAQGLTLVSVITAFVFFRATSVDSAVLIVSGMFGAAPVELPNILAAYVPGLADALRPLGISFALGGGSTFVFAWLSILAFGGLALFAPNTQQIMRLYRPALGAKALLGPPKKRRWMYWRARPYAAVLAGALFTTSLLALTQVSDFLYFQF